MKPNVKRFVLYPIAVVLATAGSVVVGAFVLTDIPQRLGLAAASPASATNETDENAEVDKNEVAKTPEPGETVSLALTARARKSLAIRSQRIRPSTFTKFIEVPGVITSWPGRTHISVTSPLTGVINAIYIARGELVVPGKRMFSLRLTHQDLVKTQEQFLAQLGQLDVEEKEIARLTEVAKSGAIAGKTLITRKYERDKLIASVEAAKQAILLHGLSEGQISQIQRTRKLIREVVVTAPHIHADSSLHFDDFSSEPGSQKIPTLRPDFSQPLSSTDRTPAKFASTVQPAPHPQHVDANLLVTALEISRGQAVEAGKTLAELSDYETLLIEGHAFQSDGLALRNAAQSQTKVQAILDSSSSQADILDGLKVTYIGNEVGKDTRALPFYLELPNEIERSEKRDDATYVSWKFKPGQRLRIRLPVTEIEDVYVVPIEAVVDEGVNHYVFLDHGVHADRVNVHIVARDNRQVAIANDGQIRRMNNRVVISSANQLQMAVKSQGGDKIDPHAGHSH